MVVYRFMQASQSAGLWPLGMFFNRLNGLLGGCIIGRGADFGPGLVLIHSNGIVINTSVAGESGTKLEHQVTIGANAVVFKGVPPDATAVGVPARVVGDAAV